MKKQFRFLALAAAAAFVLVLAAGAFQTPDTAKDPVCGMNVKIDTAKYTSDYKGTKYYFCGEGCKTSFDKDPEKYLANPGSGMMGGGMKHDMAAAQTPDTAKDPVCGMSVKISTAKYTSDYKGTKYYFCSEGCKTSFDKEPEKYLAKPGGGMMGGGMMMHNQEAQAQTPDTATDPICGMSVKISTAKYTSDYKGAKYYFCSEGCKTTFDKDPEKYVPAKCAVCGMDVKKDGAQFTTEYKGVKYYFRCGTCKAKFDKDPEKYLDKKYVPQSQEQKPDGAGCSCAACAIKK